MEIYLDNSATTKPCPEAINAITGMLSENYGNPSSLHEIGVKAAKELINSRKTVADALKCDKSEIYFTSGGTEANNLAVFGAADAGKRSGRKIVTTAIEHESVLKACDKLEGDGFEVVRLKPDKHGNITPEQFEKAVDGNTILVSVMYVNNEIGSVLPVEKLKNIIKKNSSPALLHIDCVQAFGKIDVNPKKLGADLLTITAHKIHGPKGVGALYIKKGTHIVPRAYGGEQEGRIRPGTEALPLISGFAAAIKALPDLKEEYGKIEELNFYTRQMLSQIDGIRFNSDDNTLPYILNFYIPSFMRSQTVLQELSGKYHICVSSGSACAKGRKSHVLRAMGLSNEAADKSIRVSFGRYNTKQDCEALASAVKSITAQYPVSKQKNTL